MRAGVRVTASLALALAAMLPATGFAGATSAADRKPAGGRVEVREIDRQRESEYRARFNRDDQKIDYRHYYGEHRGADGLRREARHLDYGWRGHGYHGAFIFLRDLQLGDPDPLPSAESRAETDEFGNLVVHHGSGYKQIIVGGAMVIRRAGVAAEDLFKPAPDQAPDYSNSPSVIYFDGSERRSDSGVVIIRPPAN